MELVLHESVHTQSSQLEGRTHSPDSVQSQQGGEEVEEVLIPEILVDAWHQGAGLWLPPKIEKTAPNLSCLRLSSYDWRFVTSPTSTR